MRNTSAKIKTLVTILLAIGITVLLILTGCATASPTGPTGPGLTSPAVTSPAATSPARSPTSTNASTASPTPTGSATVSPTTSPSPANTISLTSPAFREGEKLPAKYTQDADNVSPPLAWSDPPAGTRALALICEDLDGPSGIITHWIIFNIPATSKELPEAVPAQPELPNGARQGNNVRNQPGYIGPRPPEGTVHRYRFTLYALNQTLDLASGVNRVDFLAALEGKVLGQGQIMGTYQR